MTKTKASLFGELRSICGQLEEVIFSQEKGEIRTSPIYETLEGTLENALSSQIISWHEYQSEIAPYLSARINRWHVPLWFWAHWYERKESPSSLLGNAISVFDPKDLLGAEPFSSQIRVLSYKVFSYVLFRAIPKNA